MRVHHKTNGGEFVSEYTYKCLQYSQERIQELCKRSSKEGPEFANVKFGLAGKSSIHY